jgi:hypothetical protein
MRMQIHAALSLCIIYSEEYPADCRLYEETMLSSSCIARTAAFTACGWLGLSAYDAGSALSTGRLFGGWPMHPVS